MIIFAKFYFYRTQFSNLLCENSFSLKISSFFNVEFNIIRANHEEKWCKSFFHSLYILSANNNSPINLCLQSRSTWQQDVVAYAENQQIYRENFCVIKKVKKEENSNRLWIECISTNHKTFLMSQHYFVTTERCADLFKWLIRIM